MAKRTKVKTTLDLSHPTEARQKLKEQLNASADGLLITSLKDEALKGIDVISTGIPSLDIALGVGGIPRARISEIYGPNQAGKTTLALQIASNASKMGLVTMYIDAEHSLDVEYARKLGCNVDNEDEFILVQPDYGEQALNAAYEYMKYGLVDLVIVDSIAALTPKALLEAAEEEGVEKARVGEQARMMTKFLGIAVPKIKKNNISFIGLNQIRTKITPMGTSEGKLGGHAWNHDTSVVIDVRRTGREGEVGKKDSEDYAVDGGYTRAHVRKNKVGSPHKQSIFTIKFGKGADYHANLINTCARYGVGVNIAASWYTFVDSNGEILDKYQGLAKAADGIRLNTELVNSMVDQLSSKVGITLWNPNKPNEPVGPIDGIDLGSADCNIISDEFCEESDVEESSNEDSPDTEKSYAQV